VISKQKWRGLWYRCHSHCLMRQSVTLDRLLTDRLELLDVFLRTMQMRIATWVVQEVELASDDTDGLQLLLELFGDDLRGRLS
jgi:hypothetical protein